MIYVEMCGIVDDWKGYKSEVMGDFDILWIHNVRTVLRPSSTCKMKSLGGIRYKVEHCMLRCVMDETYTRQYRPRFQHGVCNPRLPISSLPHFFFQPGLLLHDM
jgi:hypothetical protein